MIAEGFAPPSDCSDCSDAADASDAGGLDCDSVMLLQDDFEDSQRNSQGFSEAAI